MTGGAGHRDEPLPRRLLVRAAYAVMGSMLAAMATSFMGLPGWAQWAAGLATLVAVALFRVVLPDGLGPLMESAREANEAAARELAEGDYDGVPTFLVPRADRDRVRAERERARGRGR